MFKYIFSSKSSKEFKNLPKQIQIDTIAIMRQICNLTHPLQSNLVLKLQGFNKPIYRIKVKNYRVIFRIEENVFFILKITSRENAYK